MKRLAKSLVVVAVLASFVAACAPPTPQVIEKEVVVEKPVVQTVVVEKEKVVEKPVVQTVIVEKVVEKPRHGGVLYWGEQVADYDGLDPHIYAFTESSYVFRHIFDQLVYLDPDNLNIVPGLATSWESNEDATEWTFKLRQDVKFHDGTPFNAEAVKVNFERIVDPATKSRMAAGLLGPYDRTEVIDDFTVKVYFKEPYPLLLYGLTRPYVAMASPTALKKYGDKFYEHLVGSGPFKFVSEVPTAEVVLERNPDYNWGPEFLHKGPAYLDGIVFKFIPDDEVRMATVETGETHIADEVPPARIESYMKAPNYQVWVVARKGIARTLHFNTELFPTDDIRVRKAIIHAIDLDGLNKAVFKGIYPTCSVVLVPGTKFYDASLENMYPHDSQKAIELLEEAGWTEVNAEGYRVKDGKELYIYHATFPGFVAEAPAEIIQAQLKKVGIKFDIHVMAGGTMMASAPAKDSIFNTALVGHYGVDPGPLLYRIYHSSGYGKTNYSHYQSKELDQLLEAGMATTDEVKRAEIYSKVQRIVHEEALVASLYANITAFVGSKAVRGFKYDAYAVPEMFDVWLAE